MTNKDNLEHLLRLMKENPDLPVLPMVDGEIAGDDCGYWLGKWGAASVDEYLLPANENDYIRFKSDDDVFDALEHQLSGKDFFMLPVAEEECRPVYNALPWKKAIIVYIGVPQEEVKQNA